MNTLEQVFYKWLLDYMPPEPADQLSALLAVEAKQYSRYQYLVGFLTGILTTIILFQIFK